MDQDRQSETNFEPVENRLDNDSAKESKSLNHIFKWISSSIITVNSRFLITGVNHLPECIPMDTKEIIGKDVREVISPTLYESDNVNDALEKVFNDYVESIDLRKVIYLDPQGNKSFWNMKINSIKDPYNNEKVIIQIDDLTSALRLEQDLDTLKEINDNIVQNIPSGILVIDLKGKIVLLNKAAETILTKKESDIIGCFHGDILGRRLDIAGDGNTWNYKTLVGRNVLTLDGINGEKVTIGYSKSVLKNRKGFAKGTIIIFQDLTEIMLLKNRLIQSEKMAGIGTLAGGIAHEFNNLIGGMMGYAQLASSTNDPNDFKKAIDVVFSSSKRAKRVITDLLTFSRRTNHEKEVISIETMIRQVLTLVERDFQKRNITVSYSFDPELMIKTDVGQVQQVLLNIVINAKHAMPNGGKLKVSTKVIGPEVHIRVSDNGVGVPKDSIDRIFEPFFTTKGSIGSGSEEGTGLGLSLSYSLIKDLGGEIKVESRENEGSTFTIILPYQKINFDDQETDSDEAEQIDDGDTQIMDEVGEKSILVVDDDRTTLELMYQVLTREGHKVITSSTGFMAIEMARNNDFDVLFIDAVMPGIDGVETLEAIREIQPEAVAVVITGQLGTDLEGIIARLSKFNAKVLQKPFEIENILEYLNDTKKRELKSIKANSSFKGEA